MKAIIWGCGGTGRDFLDRKVLNYKYDIICFTDNASNLWGSKIRDRYNVISPDEIVNYQYDVIIICSLYYKEIVKQLEELGVSEEKVITYKELEKNLCDLIVMKYQDEKDPDIISSLNVYRKGELSFFGAYNPPYTVFADVQRDGEGFPYIMFEGKKMYYPADFIFQRINGKEVVADILYEQGTDSPHKYIPDDYEMPEGAVILDAGVCEGNFALRYVETASKIYLVEADERWMNALQMTFEPFKDKVVFCGKYLSGRNNSMEITIDELVDGRLDFLKMDIEGSEVYALLGGKETLERNNTQCAVCTYHRQYDEKYVSLILNSYGYKTKPSKGYVFFSYDETIVDTLDLRRGVVYARK